MARAPHLGEQDKQQGAMPETILRAQMPGIARSVEWLLHLVYDKMVPNLRDFFGERQPLIWVIALAIGIGAAYLAIFFRFTYRAGSIAVAGNAE